MFNDGFGDLSDDVDEMIESREAILKAHARSLTKSNRELYDDVLNEGRIMFWKTFSSLEGEPLEKRTAYSVLAAKRQMFGVLPWVDNGKRYTGHLSGTGTSEVKTITVLDTPVGDSGSTSLLELIVNAADVLDGVEMAYHYGEIMQAINSLPEAHREYVFFKFWRGYSDSEIARMQGVSTSGLYNRWDRTIRPKLQESLKHLALAVREA